MSEENVPRLRLRPKLAPQPGDPAIAQPSPSAQPAPVQPAPSAPAPLAPTPAVPAGPESLVPPATADAPKFVRLKPRLTVTPPAESAEKTAAQDEPPRLAEPAPEPVREVSSPPPEPHAPAPAPERPASKFSLRAKAGAHPPAPGAAVPQEPVVGEATSFKIEPLVLSAPGSTEAGSPPGGPPPVGGPSMVPLAPTAAFPSPTAVIVQRRSSPLIEDKPLPVVKPRKKSGVQGVLLSVLLVLLAGAGGYYAYLTFFAVPPPPEPGPRMAARPVTPQGQAVAKAKAAVEQIQAQVNAAADPTGQPAGTPATPAASPATSVPEPAAPAVVAPPVVVPVASMQFRAWVENLHINGVRGGESEPKVLIGGATYSVGDLVNPQLGISFGGYHTGTRMLIFKDKTGATVEKRN